MEPEATSQPHILEVDTHEAESDDFPSSSMIPTASSDMFQPLHTYTYLSNPSMTSQSGETDIWDAGQLQAKPSPPNNRFGPTRMANDNRAGHGLTDLDRQDILPSGLNAHGQLSASRTEQMSRLRAESMNEVQLHLKILTAYFSHVHRHGFEEISPTRAAVGHWIECAKRWESAVPESWKAKLPTPPAQANAIQAMLYRQIRVQVMMETQRRGEPGIGSESGPGPGPGFEQQLAPERQDDINMAAFKEQVELMKTWTRMFSEMLDELRREFPLFEDTWQDFQRAGGWAGLLGCEIQNAEC